MENGRESVVMRISRNTLLGNVFLTILKLSAGIVSHSSAMVSDSIHSLSDIFSTLIVMIGVRLAGNCADKEHPYGHERFECVAAIILSALLFVTGIGIGYGGSRAILTAKIHTPAIPGLLALNAAIVSIVTKEAMYWYTRIAAKKVHCSALMADAWHHRSDALSSFGSFIGILGSRIGFPVLDAVACLVICVFICKSAADIFIDAISKMTDKACDDKTVEQIRLLILEQEQVNGIDLLQTRLFGDRIYVDVEIRADGNLTLYDSHDIAHAVHDVIEKRLKEVKHCMVHVNPE